MVLHFNTFLLKKQDKVLRWSNLSQLFNIILDFTIDTKFRLDSKHFVGKRESIKWNKKLEQDFYVDRI